MTTLQRRQLLASAAGLAAASILPAQAQAPYPQRPITIVDAFASGGSSDIFARLLGDLIGPTLGTSVIVENRLGAGGALGADYVYKAQPDGYTLGIATVSTLATNPAANPRISYDPLRFTHISKLVEVPSVLVVHPSVPARTLQELVQLAKAKPNSMTFSTPGVGSAGHIVLEQFMQLSGARFLHVPYRGAANGINDLLGGHIQITSDNLPSILPHIQSGKLRAIAVRDKQRLKLLPDVPTYAEAGYPEVSVPLWFGLVGPANLPAPIVAQLNAAVRKAVASPRFVERMQAVGATPAVGTPEAFRTEAAALLERYRQVVKSANITMD